MTIAALDASDLPAAARVLTRAFRDNPGMLAILRGDPPELRERLLEPCMVGFTRAALRWGVAEVARLDGEIRGVSLSFLPGEFPPPFWSMFVMARGPLLAGPRRALRFARVDHTQRQNHPRDRHAYLWFLAVDPAAQGRGLGSALLESLARKAAAERVQCYLETDKASLVRLYERHGYAVKGETWVRGLDLRLWLMRTRT